LKIAPSAEDPRDIWVYVAILERESMALRKFAAKMNIDILVKYGYSISVMTHFREHEVAEPQTVA
jgi:hypothetical protein